MREKIKYELRVKPALPVQDRHMLEDVLKNVGYNVWGGGTHTDGSSCDITFDGSDNSDKTDDKL